MEEIEYTLVEHVDVEEKKLQITQQLQQGWSKYPRNSGQSLSRPVMEKIQGLFLLGQHNKKRKVSV